MPLGLPMPMFLVFAATILAGSLGAIHYVVVHVFMGRPFAEVHPPAVRGARDPTADSGAPGPDRGASGAAPHDAERDGNPDADPDRGSHG